MRLNDSLWEIVACGIVGGGLAWIVWNLAQRVCVCHGG